MAEVTAWLDALHTLHLEHEQLVKIAEAQRLEIERLTDQLRELRAGVGVFVVIDGQAPIPLAVLPPSASTHIADQGTATLNGHKSDKSELADSFVL